MPHVGLEPTPVRLRVVSATDCASEAISKTEKPSDYHTETELRYRKDDMKNCRGASQGIHFA